jgi:hypothetical protein
MRIFLLILFHPIICVSQINAIQAPISYNLESYNFKDSLLLIEEDNAKAVWVKFKKDDTYLFNVLNEGDTLINMKLSMLDKLKTIETSLYIAKYSYKQFKSKIYE